jgi:hypothetical protein
MIDRLRALANRPIRHEDRTKAFALAAALVVVALVGLLTLERPSRPAAEPERRAPTAAPATEAPPPTADAAERTPSARELRTARRVARRFVAGYLDYSYGRGSADEIDGATALLRDDLAAEPPRVPPTVARLEPELLTVQLEADGLDDIEAVALVRDGRRTYSTTLELEQSGESWLVSGLGS